MQQILRRINDWPLGTKLIGAFTLLCMAAIVLVTLVSVLVATDQLSRQLRNSMMAIAAGEGESAGDLLAGQIVLLKAGLATDDMVIEAVQAANADYQGSDEEVQAKLLVLDTQWIEAPQEGSALLYRVLNNITARRFQSYRVQVPEQVELLVTDRYGALVAASNRTSDYYQADEEWWQKGWNNGQGAVFITEPELDASTNVMSLSLIVPIFDHQSDKTIGIIKAVYDLEQVQARMTRRKLGQTGHLYLLTSQGMMVVAKQIEDVGQPAEDSLLLGGAVFSDSGFAPSVQDVDGRTYVMAYVPITSGGVVPEIDDLGWVTLVLQERAEAFASVGQIRLTGALGAILAALIGSVLVFVLSRVLVTRQVGEIQKVFHAAGMGSFDTRAQVFSRDEIGQMAENVNILLIRLSSLIQMAESERASFMESFSGVVALTDMEGGVTYMNLAGAQMAGYDDPGKIVGVKQFSELISPEYLQLTMEVGVPTAIEKGSWAGESKLLMLDGSIIPVDQTIFVVRDEQGKPRNLGILMTDISAHKLAEAQLAAQNEALNNALEELRKLITDVDFAAQQMAGASESIVNVVTLLAGQASTSAQMAENAASSAKSGDEAVASTISAMGRIRESTQETTRRIKRLGEASQEIGEVVRLIDEIADRVTVLALNASIQAAAAGEAGRGFAVVAEEVQRLAERATNATRQIENMVKSIQGEINEAMIGVEEATREVVDGSQLAQSAGERITDLNLAIGELSDLIQHVSDTTAQQTTEALASLAALAADLQASVSALEIPAEPSQISGNGGGRTAAQLGGMIES